MERAMDWIFSHPDDDGEEDAPMEGANNVAEIEDAMYTNKNPGLYNLHGFITHLGSGVHAGHYVCHINKEESTENQEKKWVYFNDAKVAITNDAPFGKGYMYFFKKI